VCQIIAIAEINKNWYLHSNSLIAGW
jgi:hypothetical protein